MIGLTPLVTFPRARHLHHVAAKVPLDRLVLETDAPYFLPEKARDADPDLTFSHPGLAVHAAAQIAAIKGVPLAEVVEATRANAIRVYRLSEDMLVVRPAAESAAASAKEPTATFIQDYQDQADDFLGRLTTMRPRSSPGPKLAEAKRRTRAVATRPSLPEQPSGSPATTAGGGGDAPAAVIRVEIIPLPDSEDDEDQPTLRSYKVRN